jgi:hypothetical protein
LEHFASSELNNAPFQQWLSLPIVTMQQKHKSKAVVLLSARRRRRKKKKKKIGKKSMNSDDDYPTNHITLHVNPTN